MTNTLTITISGNAVQVIEGSLQLKSRVDDKDSCTFTVRDDSGTAAYSKGQPVVVTDSVLGKLFTGFINKPTATNLYPNATNLWSMDCVNQFYVAAKKATQPKKRGGKHKNQPAGAIAANQIQQYLEPDGVSGNFGLDWSELQTDWQSGVLTGTTGATNTSTGNPGAGDLELAASGNQVVVSGPGTGFSLNNGLLLTGYASSGYSSAYTNRQIWSGSQAVQTGDTFLYDVWVASSSPAIKAGCDFICSDGTVFSTNGGTQDKQYLSPLISTDLSGLANDQWYTRAFLVPASLNGKTLASVTVGFNSANAGTYTAYFRHIEYQISGGGTTIFFGDTSTLQTNVQVNNVGYTNVSLTQVLLENKTAQITAPGLSIGAAGIVQTSQISWAESLPSGATGIRETSIDNGASWQTATNGGTIPNLLPGMVVTGRSIAYRDTYTVGTDPTASIGFGGPTMTIVPAYASAKTDSISTYTTATDFNTGTLTNLTTIGSGTTQGIMLNGFQRNWDSGDFSNQPLWGSASPFQQVENKQMILQSGAGTDAKSQMLDAGQWQNFTAEVDVIVPSNSASSECGLVYRTSSGSWQNNNDTYAYQASVAQNQVLLGRGTNSGSGSGSFHLIASASLALAANSIHRLKVVVNGSSHALYLDGVLLLSASDSTYTSAGYIGLRVYNAATGTATGTFDNFGVCANLSGTWQSPSINIAGPGTYGGSLVQWDIDGLPDNTTSISVQTSIDGGSTWQSVSNGGVISGLTAGQSLTGKTLLLLVTLTANTAPVVPSMLGISAWILGQYSSSGTRSTAPLAWDNMIRGNVSGGFGTATNGATYTQTGTGTVALTSDEATITNTTGDVHMQISGVSGTDEETTLRFQLSASTMSAGVELRYVDANNYFRLEATQNSLSIIIAIRGVVSTLATATPTISTSTFYRLRFRVAGNGPTNFYGRVWTDGSSEPLTWSITAVL